GGESCERERCARSIAVVALGWRVRAVCCARVVADEGLAAARALVAPGPAAGPVRAELVVFFFPSRGRHTTLVSDWSSDVCSSDLPISKPAPDNGDRRIRYSSRLPDNKV